MKIHRLYSENFKRISVVDIAPGDDGLIEVRGQNGEGKTSVLDSIMAALGGANMSPIKPVRTGEEYAIVRLDLGELRVTRYFDEKGDALKVENADGATFAKPQTMLDALVGQIAFDPLAFARMDAKEQAAELRRLVPLDVDLDELARLDKADKEARRDINRDGRNLVARRDILIVPNDLPTDRPDREALVAELARAGETNTQISEIKYQREKVERDAQRASDEADVLDARAKRLREEADTVEGQAKAMRAEVEKVRALQATMSPLPDPVDVTELQGRIADAERVLRLFAAKDEAAALDEQIAEKTTASEALTAKLTARAEQRTKALAAAKMPVDGLSIAALKDAVPGEESDDLIVTYQGEPFAQASGAQQLRVSMALAMAANPKLRVMLIKDGSLLDQSGLALVREMADKGDYQVWLEAVGDGDGVGIIMEAGAVRGAPDPERVEPPVKRRRDKDISEGEGNAALDPGGSRQADQEAGAAAPLAPASDNNRPRRPRAVGEITTPKPGGLFGDQ